MPPKKAAPSRAPAKSTFFEPGFREESVTITPKPPPPKKATALPVAPAPPKSTFFKKGFRKPAAVIPPAPVPTFTRQPFVPRRSFLYDKHTEEPYAEWMGNEAVCLETGEVLFESKGRGGEDEFSFGGGGGVSEPIKFDYTPPKQRHPKDPSIDTLDLISAGIITLEDFKIGKSALSAEAYAKWKSVGCKPFCLI